MQILHVRAAFIAFVYTAVAVLESPNRFLNQSSLSQRQVNSTVTVEFNLPQNGLDSFGNVTYKRYRELIHRKWKERLSTTILLTTSLSPTTAEPSTTTTEPSTTPTTTPTTTPSTTPTTTEPTTEPSTTPTTTPTTTLSTTPTTTEPSTVTTTTPTTTPTTTGSTSTTWVPKRRRRRRDVTQPADDFDIDDIQFVELDPKVKGDVIRVSVLINNQEVPEDLLWEIINELNQENALEKELNFTVHKEGGSDRIYQGLPVDSKSSELVSSANVDWRFYLAMLLLIVLFIVLVFTIFCVVRHKYSKPRVNEDKRSEPESEVPIITPARQPSLKQAPNGYEVLDEAIMPYEQALLLLKNTLNNSVSLEQTPM